MGRCSGAAAGGVWVGVWGVCGGCWVCGGGFIAAGLAGHQCVVPLIHGPVPQP